MYKFLIIPMLFLMYSCHKPNYTLETMEIDGNPHQFIHYYNQSIEHNPSCMYCVAKPAQSILRKEILTEGEEPHEVWIITTDTAVITDHCDDCKFCITDNPEGNPD